MTPSRTRWAFQVCEGSTIVAIIACPEHGFSLELVEADGTVSSTDIPGDVAKATVYAMRRTVTAMLGERN